MKILKNGYCDLDEDIVLSIFDDLVGISYGVDCLRGEIQDYLYDMYDNQELHFLYMVKEIFMERGNWMGFTVSIDNSFPRNNYALIELGKV